MYSPQKRQVGSAFALTYRFLLRSCKLIGVFVISPLPSLWLEPVQTAGPLCSTDITRFSATTDPSVTLSPFHRFPAFRLYGFSMLRRFRGGTRRASPVARRILVIVLSLLPRQSVPPHRSDCGVPCCLHSTTENSASGVNIFGATCAFTFVTAR